ncbi:uncharacterized protein At1g66480-like [Actinidia eriantha]|uniref:uncharacterized protein At1g66480-like n=1 Tax=Actinidia eriantha TaxID=165200 RepID=UPI00258A4715|nr:uncharacterized protein At1g66480-like [Actinidia eriantha]
MGNILGEKKSTTSIMKVNGETLKLKTPVQAGEIVKDYPGHVLLESEAVKHFGVRAKPLEARQKLEPNMLYFLVDLPKFREKEPRKVRSGIDMSAKERLESLMISRRSVSDLSLTLEERERLDTGIPTRVKVRVSKEEMLKLMRESKDESEITEKILGLCMENKAAHNSGVLPEGGSAPPLLHHQQLHCKGGHGREVKAGLKAREKRVGFLPVIQGEIQIGVAS